MLLGEYAGRGLGYEESKTMTFEAQEHGYWIGLCAIVPESGYSQGLDPSVLALNRWQQYQPEFDGFGLRLRLNLLFVVLCLLLVIAVMILTA